jgi:cytochrome c-type biogenesis protein
MGLVVAVLGSCSRADALREVRVADRAPTGGIASAPVLGFVFGVGWTPCLGPAAGAILTLSAGVTGGVSSAARSSGSCTRSGWACPSSVRGAVPPDVRALGFLQRNARNLQIAGGACSWLVGVALATGLWDQFIFCSDR